jgi:para-nitrobenzyl esterase
MALRWIKKNISKFGGDPENITIMGESAGSISVTTLMGLPQSKGLFSKAIAESGTCYKYLRTLEDASRRTSRFLECAHVKRDQKPEDVVASLRKLSSKDIVRATAKQLADNMLEACVVFAPVLDGDFVPEDPAEAIRKGSAAGVALLHGTNEDEYRYWLCYFSALRNIPLKDLFKFLPSSLREKLDAHKAEILDFYGKKYPGPNKGDGTLAFVTDVMFRIPHIRVSDAQAQDPKNRVWLYRFNWKSHVKDYLGACHAIEIPFVFRTFSSPLSEEIVGPNPPMELSDIMQDAWINFARTGNPNHPGMPEWPAYDPNRRATMILDTKCETKDDPDRDVREFYTNQVPW